MLVTLHLSRQDRVFVEDEDVHLFDPTCFVEILIGDSFVVVNDSMSHFRRLSHEQFPYRGEHFPR